MLEKENGSLKIEGGLILLKLNELASGFKSGVISIKYDDIEGKSYKQDYVIDFAKVKLEEVKSSSSNVSESEKCPIDEASAIFYYGSFMRRLLKVIGKKKSYKYMEKEKLQNTVASIKSYLSTHLSKTLSDKFSKNDTLVN